MQTTTATTFAPTNTIFVGTSPAGVEWRVYRKPGETDAAMSERAQHQLARLEVMRERELARVAAAAPVAPRAPASLLDTDPMAIVRVRGLTAIQVDRLSAEAGEVETDADHAAWVDGATFVEGTVRHLAAVLDRLAARPLDDLAETWNAKTDAQYAMARRAARVSQVSACGKLAAALRMPVLAATYASAMKRTAKMNVASAADME